MITNNLLYIKVVNKGIVFYLINNYNISKNRLNDSYKIYDLIN